MRKLTSIELAIGASLVGCLLAVGVPTFVREVHASRFVEPEVGLANLGAGALAYAEANGAFPANAPLTPHEPPRGKKDVDPPGTWDTPSWRALAFRPSPEGVPHAYAFSFEATPPHPTAVPPQGASFVARAHGDLDGDGIWSTFETRGVARPGAKPELVPGMYVEAELE
jgi:hypothetical protein